jgi:hypothetical protein
MSKLAFVAISACSWLNPVLAHLSFVFSLVNLRLGLVLTILWVFWELLLIQVGIWTSYVGGLLYSKAVISIILNLLCWIVSGEHSSSVFSNVHRLSAHVSCYVIKWLSCGVAWNEFHLVVVLFLIHGLIFL